MSLSEAQAQFAAEFVTLMVAASALALVALRRPGQGRPGQGRPGQGRWGQGRPGQGRRAVVGVSTVLYCAGLLAVALAAFLHGSLLVTSESTVKELGVLRLAGAALLLPVLPWWWAARQGPGRFAPWMLRGGIVAWGGAGVAEVAEASNWLVDGLLVGGAALVGVALLGSARRSIASRVAASGAATLLLVVLVLSLSLSAAISSSVQRDGLNRLASRMNIEEKAASSPDPNPAADTAKSVGSFLGVVFNQLKTNPLAQLDEPDVAGQHQASALISHQLDAESTELYKGGGLAYASLNGGIVIPAPPSFAAAAYALARDTSLAFTPCSAGAQGLFVLDGQAWLAASYPECSAQGKPVGTVFSGEAVNNQYLASRLDIDPTVSLTLLTGSSILASAGPQPPASVLARAAKSERSGGQAMTEAVGDRFISVAVLPVSGYTRPVALVLSTPATTVLSTRTQLYRTLFLIALGGTLLALGLAIFTGDRITAGVRRLTDAATRIQSGETAVRAEMGGEDEVAALGSAFDAMLESVSAQASALRAAADDETQLRNRMEAVVAGMSDGLVAFDPFGRITDFNQAAEELTGVAAGVALGSSAASVVKLTSEDGLPLEGRMFTPSESPWAALGELHQRGGVRIPVAVSVGGLRGPAGDLIGSVLVFRDLRREREVEQMKTEFLSRVGHELRTPLTGIMGYADILLRRDVPAERARTWHEEMLLSARRLLRIVEMLEFFASTGAGRMTLRLEPVDIGGLVNAIASSWSSRKLPGYSFRRRTARDLPNVLGDRRWLALAIDELVDNAVKFSPDGGPILLDSQLTSPVTGNGKDRAGIEGGSRMVEISIRDRGVGMTAVEYAVVFSDFVQADNSDTRRFGGLGLGLALVRRVVEDHGGDITCRSASGRGTTFTIRLPAVAPTSRPARRPAKGRRSPTRATSSS